MRTLTFNVNDEYNNRKVLHFLRGNAGLSARLVRSLKQVDNGILLNGLKTTVVDKINTGDIITINIPDDDVYATPTDYEIDVIFEDEDLLIVNKPANLPMHPSHNHQGDTLANAVSWHLQKENKFSTFRAIGRLDKGTSGIVICALNSYAANKLSGNFKKEYNAIVQGNLSGSGTIDLPIYRPDPIKMNRAVGEKGDEAITHWTCLENKNNMSLLKIKLDTGRTHQIRVHFSHIGYPLVGDRMYGEENEIIERQALHCYKVDFIHPVTDEHIVLETQLPDDMKKVF